MKDYGFKLAKEISRRYPAQAITDADYADDIALLASTAASGDIRKFIHLSKGFNPKVIVITWLDFELDVAVQHVSHYATEIYPTSLALYNVPLTIIKYRINDLEIMHLYVNCGWCSCFGEIFYVSSNNVGGGWRIHRLNLCRPPQWMSWYDTKQSDG